MCVRVRSQVRASHTRHDVEEGAARTPNPSCLTRAACSPMISAMCWASTKGVAPSCYRPGVASEVGSTRHHGYEWIPTELPMTRILFAYVPLNGPWYRSGARTGQYEHLSHGMGQNAPTGIAGRQSSTES